MGEVTLVWTQGAHIYMLILSSSVFLLLQLADCVCVHVCMCAVHVYRSEADLVCLPSSLPTIHTEATCGVPTPTQLLGVFWGSRLLSSGMHSKYFPHWIISSVKDNNVDQHMDFILYFQFQGNSTAQIAGSCNWTEKKINSCENLLGNIRPQQNFQTTQTSSP